MFASFFNPRPAPAPASSTLPNSSNPSDFPHDFDLPSLIASILSIPSTPGASSSSHSPPIFQATGNNVKITDEALQAMIQAAFLESQNEAHTPTQSSPRSQPQPQSRSHQYGAAGDVETEPETDYTLETDYTSDSDSDDGETTPRGRSPPPGMEPRELTWSRNRGSGRRRSESWYDKVGAVVGQVGGLVKGMEEKARVGARRNHAEGGEEEGYSEDELAYGYESSTSTDYRHPQEEEDWRREGRLLDAETIRRIVKMWIERGGGELRGRKREVREWWEEGEGIEGRRRKVESWWREFVKEEQGEEDWWDYGGSSWESGRE